MATDDSLDRIRQLWYAGHDTREIADMLGIPESVVYNALSIVRGRPSDRQIRKPGRGKYRRIRLQA